MSRDMADALRDTLISPNVRDANWESANVVDVLQHIANAGGKLADAITPRSAAPGIDETGGHVGSLTEAVMGMTKALVGIAEAINNVAESIREGRDA